MKQCWWPQGLGTLAPGLIIINLRDMLTMRSTSLAAGIFHISPLGIGETHPPMRFNFGQHGHKACGYIWGEIRWAQQGSARRGRKLK